jgi:CO/xanthine dehydrogenase Mo-binding subunit/CO/xanthine dehydrogenase FAD-binding subunit
MNHYLGKRVPQIDWRDKTSGKSLYTADLHFNDLLIAKVLRSPYPYAEILSIDTSAAEALPGVHAVITIRDFPAGARYNHEGARDRPPLADGIVRYIGEEIAAVAAESVQAAAAALHAIRIGYRPRQAPLSPQAALQPHSISLHARPTARKNVSRGLTRRWGDPKNLDLNSLVSVDGTYEFGRQTHACMEPNSIVADWRESEEKLHLWVSTQAPIFVRDEVAQVLGLSAEQVVCHEVAVGGGFGSKSRISEHEAIASALSIKSRRPVRLVLDRSEEFETTKSRHPFHTRMTLRADQNGMLKSIEGVIQVENGAYDHSGLSVMGAGMKGLGLIYQPDHVSLDGSLIDTAMLPGGAFRGYGTTQITFALECLMDDLARKFRCDPVDFRIQNAQVDGHTSVLGAEQLTVRLRECLKAARDAIGWDRLKRERPDGDGVGIAAGVHLSGSYVERDDANRCDAALDFYANGRVRLRFGVADTGTGQRTILAQIVASELSLPLESIDVFTMDTEKTPFDLGAWSSRGTHFSAHAARIVCDEAKRKLFSIAASRLGQGSPSLAEAQVVIDGAGISFGELVALSNESVDGVLTVEASFVDRNVVRPSSKTGMGNMSASYNFAAHSAHVHVDKRTGEIRIRDYVAAHDAGSVLNPLSLEGQIVGGAMMGIGAALGEQMVFEQGKLASSGYIYYPLMRAGDAPTVRSLFVESNDPRGPYGAKAVGELGINPPPAVISNAVFDAIGIRFTTLPITPDKVLVALRGKTGKRRDFRIRRRPDRWWIAFVRWAYPLGLLRVLHSFRRGRSSRIVPGPLLGIETPEDLQKAIGLLNRDALPMGGGTDLFPRRNQGTVTASRFISLSDIQSLKQRRTLSDGTVEIGASTTLAELCKPDTPHPLLAAAATTIASPQIRNMATLAGNLAQAKRCWFYRSGFECYKRVGSTAPCYAVTGDHRYYHAAIDGHRCQAVTPSDMATALIALDAELVLQRITSSRTIKVAQLYNGPGETVLAEGELITAALIKPDAMRRRAAFEKLRRWDGDFAIVSAAISALIDENGLWHDIRIVCGGIGPTPWRATATELRLNGTIVTPSELRLAIDEELDAKAHPLQGNAWKIDALAGLCERAVEKLTMSA